MTYRSILTVVVLGTYITNSLNPVKHREVWGEDEEKETKVENV
jgi:hypothetical protein